MSKALLAVVVFVVVIVTAGARVMAQEKTPLVQPPEVDAADADACEAYMQKLRGPKDDKIQAARFFAAATQDVTPELIHALSQPLLSDGDQTVRMQCVDALRSLASRNNTKAPRAEKHEPQMIAVLSAAYANEKDPNVKRSIVESLAEFNDPEAVSILNDALKDGNPAIREAAQKAKIKRDRRLFFARCG